MINISEKLSKPFPYARIDLYNLDGKIYFGEITLTDGSGYMTFIPDSFDYEFGAKFVLPEKMIEESRAPIRGYRVRYKSMPMPSDNILEAVA